MSNQLSYEQAMNQLEQLTDQIQNDQVSIDDMETQLQKAAELIAYCRGRLRSTENSIDSLFGEDA